MNRSPSGMLSELNGFLCVSLAMTILIRFSPALIPDNAAAANDTGSGMYHSMHAGTCRARYRLETAFRKSRGMSFIQAQAFAELQAPTTDAEYVHGQLTN